MHLTSLAYRTDLYFPRFEGLIEERADYIAVKTPANPGFYWGNFLIFREPARAGDLERWGECFEREFAGDPGVRHKAFGCDTTGGELGAVRPFAARGYQLLNDPVLVLEAAPRPRDCELQLELRALASASDREALVELNAVQEHVAAAEEYSRVSESYRLFRRRSRERYMRMLDAGRGLWFGAFHQERLIADLGLFVEGDTARFQRVETHPEFRRRGVCSALLAHACRVGFEDLHAHRLVIVGEQGSSAERVYRGVGFQERERQVGLCLSAPAEV